MPAAGRGPSQPCSYPNAETPCICRGFSLQTALRLRAGKITHQMLGARTREDGSETKSGSVPLREPSLLEKNTPYSATRSSWLTYLPSPGLPTTKSMLRFPMQTFLSNTLASMCRREGNACFLPPRLTSLSIGACLICRGPTPAAPRTQQVGHGVNHGEGGAATDHCARIETCEAHEPTVRQHRCRFDFPSPKVSPYLSGVAGFLYGCFPGSKPPQAHTAGASNPCFLKRM